MSPQLTKKCLVYQAYPLYQRRSMTVMHGWMTDDLLQERVWKLTESVQLYDSAD